MCIDLGSWLLKLNSLTYSQLANVQTVGIGLYLALAIIQAVSDGGVAGLRRRAITLDAAISSARKISLKPESGSILTDLGGLEMSFEKVNRTILRTVVLLFSSSIVYFAYCTIWQDTQVHIKAAVFILFFYLALPVVIFVVAARYISWRCKEIGERIKTLQALYLTAAFGD